jgi:hypothetical protein
VKLQNGEKGWKAMERWLSDDDVIIEHTCVDADVRRLMMHCYSEPVDDGGSSFGTNACARASKMKEFVCLLFRAFEQKSSRGFKLN